MKKLFFSALMALTTLALVACGGNATAGTLTQNFKGDSGYVVQIHSALSFKQVSGAVEVVAANGSTYSIPDTSGAMFTKMVNASVGTYVNIPGTMEYISTLAPMYIMCYSNGTQTAFAYNTPAQARFIADNCALYNSIRAQSN